MKYFILFLFVLCFLGIHCIDDAGDPYFTDLTGYIFRIDTFIDTSGTIIDTVGLNDILLKIYDIDPADLQRSRMRERTTAQHDSVNGYYFVDSVIYGTTKMQGIGYVSIVIDSIDNPSLPSQIWHPYLEGGEDYCTLFVQKD